MEDLVLARSARDFGVRAELQRQVRHGALERIAPGVYAPHAERDEVERHCLLMRAVQAKAATGPVFSHISAAVIWDLATVRPLPTRAHVSAGASSGGRSTTIVIRHGVDPGAVTTRAGFLVTALSRTVIDSMRGTTLHEAVALADSALRGSTSADPFSRRAVTPDELQAELELAGVGRGVATARAGVNLASALSGSAGESCSRVTMAQAGVGAPILQRAFHDENGLIGFADFWWPEHNLIGEFDGYVKYSDPRFLHGRTPQQALRDEKVREDRLRAVGPRVARWGWREAFSPAELRRILKI